MSNPIIRLVETPVQALTDAAWVAVLLGALVITWWALGRNLLYLRERYQNGWKYLVPLQYAARVTAVCLITAIDLWLLSGILYVLTT